MKMISTKRINRAMRERRAIKHFEPSFEVPMSDREHILTFATDLALGFDHLPLRICRVTNPALREQISNVGFNQPQHTQASELWVICIDTNVLPKEEQANARDNAMLYGAAYSQALMIAAASMGYDSCPMIGFQFDEVKKLVSVPGSYVLCNFVVLGKRSKAPLPRGSKLPADELLITDAFA